VELLGRKTSPAALRGDEGMAIIGIGIDLAPVERVKGAWERHGERFLEKVFLPGEVRHTPGSPPFFEHVAGLFAAKEAAMKALGSGWGEGVGFHAIRIAREGSGAPRLELDGEAAMRAARLGAGCFYLSITHAAGLAVAVVVLESSGEGTSRQLTG
jgi:holo-[acyl-carrier protein] synthase